MGEHATWRSVERTSGLTEMMFALSDAAWGFLGLSLVQVFAFLALFVRQGRNGASIDQINTAVNHQVEGEPTLVQRVANVEHAVTTAGLHRAWEKSAFTTLAHHVGCVLPPYPHIHDNESDGEQ